MTTASAPGSATIPKGLHIALWIVQVLLAVAFGMVGAMKAFSPMDQLAAQVPWSVVVGEGMTRFIGVSELLGGIGMILPAVTRIKPVLTALAGAGLATVMVLAMGFHASRGEFNVIPVNMVLGGLAVFVAWGRFRKAPIAPRA